MKLIFCIQVSMKACYKLIDGQKYGQWMVKNSQSSQNSKFAMSLQYLKKEVKAEVDFLHAEFPSLFQHFEHQSFLQGWYYHY